MNSGTLVKMLAAIPALAGIFILLKFTAGRQRPERNLLSLKENEVAKIEISTGGSSCVLERGPDGWRLESPVAYKADQELVKNFVSGLARGRLSDALSSNPSAWPVFELDAARAVKAAVYAEKAARPSLEFYAGKEGSAGMESVYVRFEGENSVYEAGGLSRYDFERPCNGWKSEKDFR